MGLIKLKQVEWLLKKKHSSFTLLETLVSLMVTSLGISLFMGFLTNVNNNLRNPYQDDLAQVEQLVSVLRSKGLGLSYQKTTFGEVFFYSQPRKATYHLKYERNKLWLNQDGQGYMPLLFEVEEFKTSWDDKNHSLALMMKLHGRVIKRSLVMAKASEVKENTKEISKES